VKVVIRIRPIEHEEASTHQSVQLDAHEENTLVVNATNKREYFTFDYVAG
jgi:hypothetical protein